MSLPGRGKNKKNSAVRAPRLQICRRAQRVFQGAKRPPKRPPPRRNSRLGCRFLIPAIRASRLQDQSSPQGEFTKARSAPSEAANRLHFCRRSCLRNDLPRPCRSRLALHCGRPFPPSRLAVGWTRTHCPRTSRSDGLAPIALAPRGRMDSHPLPSRPAVKHTVQPTATPPAPGIAPPRKPPGIDTCPATATDRRPALVCFFLRRKNAGSVYLISKSFDNLFYQTKLFRF